MKKYLTIAFIVSIGFAVFLTTTRDDFRQSDDRGQKEGLFSQFLSDPQPSEQQAEPLAPDADIDALIRELRRDDPIARSDAAFTLGKLGAVAKPAIPMLVKSLHDRNPQVRNNSEIALIAIGKDSVPYLVKTLSEKDPLYRRSAAKILGEIAAHAEIAVEKLIFLLQDPDDYVRMDVAEALGKIAQKITIVVPALIPLLDDSHSQVRSAALEALGKIGLRHPAVLPALTRGLQDSDAIVRRTAIATFCEIGEKECQEVLELYRHSEERLHKIREILEKGRKGYRELISLLRKQDTNRQDFVEKIDKKVDEIHKQTFSILNFCIERDTDTTVRQAAAEALGRIAQGESRIISKFLQNSQLQYSALSDRLSKKIYLVYMRRGAASYFFLPKNSDGALAVLCKKLQHTDVFVRRSTIATLEKIAKAELPTAYEFLSTSTSRFVPDDIVNSFEVVYRREEIILDALLASLRDSDEIIRNSALNTLASLLENCISSDAQKQVYSRRTTRNQHSLDRAKIFEKKSQIISAFTILLSDKSPVLQIESRKVIIRLGSSILPELLASIDNNPEQIHTLAEEVTEKTLPDISTDQLKQLYLVLSKNYSNPSPNIRAATIVILGKIAKGIHEKSDLKWKIALDHVMTVLDGAQKDSEEQVRYAVVQVLAEEASRGRIWRSHLAVLLDDPSVRIRKATLQILSKDDKNFRLHTIVIKVLHNDSSLEVKREAAIILAKVVRRRGMRRQVLEKALINQPRSIQDVAFQTLETHEESVEERVDRLISSLLNQRNYTSHYEAKELGKLGEKAAKAIPALTIALTFRSHKTRKAAAEALGKIGAKAVPELAKVLQKGDNSTRVLVISTLAGIGEQAAPAIPDLARAIDDEDVSVRRAAVKALTKIVDKEGLAVSTLVNALQDDDAFLRRDAAEALAKIGDKATNAVPALIEKLDDESYYVRAAVIEALAAIQKQSVVPMLIQKLDDKVYFVRVAAAKSLGMIGPPAADAIPALEKAAKDTQRSVAREAREALRKIRH